MSKNVKCFVGQGEHKSIHLRMHRVRLSERIREGGWGRVRWDKSSPWAELGLRTNKVQGGGRQGAGVAGLGPSWGRRHRQASGPVWPLMYWAGLSPQAIRLHCSFFLPLLWGGGTLDAAADRKAAWVVRGYRTGRWGPQDLKPRLCLQLAV